MKDFLNENKVWIAGLVQFILTALTELTVDPNGHYNVYIIVYSAVIAALTYAGRNLRGQWASISMAILSTTMVFGSLHDTQTAITYQIVMIRMVMPLALAILGIFFTSPPKSREYEHSEPIVAAKEEAAVMKQAKKNDNNGDNVSTSRGDFNVDPTKH